MSDTSFRTSIFVLLLLLITGIVLTPGYLVLQMMNAQEQDTKQQLEIEILILETENAQLREMLSIMQGERDKLQGELTRKIEQWLQQWEVKSVDITGYAPLDSRAIEGMCYSGDPNITTSGEQVVPGATVAAGPDIPFGTRVYVEGTMRVVQDRGGRIGNGNLDLCVETQEEAYAIGRREVLVVIER